MDEPIASRNISIQELKTYLNSLEHEKQSVILEQEHDYKVMCNSNMMKVRKKELAKIEKNVEKEFAEKFKVKDQILELLAEIKEIPSKIEKLEIAEYMVYRIDMRRTEKVINKATKKLERRYEVIVEEIDKLIDIFPSLDDVSMVDYSEYQTQGNRLELTKEQYKLEFTEEEREKLIEKELEIIDKVKEFNTIPIPHEILKNSDREIQSKMQKFNTIRQKRIRLLATMKEDYEKLLDPRELMRVIDDAITNIKVVKDILTNSEYRTVKNALIKRRKKLYRSTRDIRMLIETKEKKTGIQAFNIQEARYTRMDCLRDTINEATSLIKENPIEELQKQLDKLKTAYEREKQFASVIEKLNDGRSGGTTAEVRAYEEQIYQLNERLINSRKIVTDSQERIKRAKQELLVLWKIEINSAVSKKRETTLELPAPRTSRRSTNEAKIGKNIFIKLGKASKGKHAMD